MGYVEFRLKFKFKSGTERSPHCVMNMRAIVMFYAQSTLLKQMTMCKLQEPLGNGFEHFESLDSFE